MPKAFDEKDKEKIKKRLINKGRALFERFGLKKTSVAEIAEAANIAKGSFYNFYSSKEELLVDIIDAFEGEMQEKLITHITQLNLGRKAMLKELLGFVFDKQNDYPLIEITMNEKQMQEILTKIPQEKLTRFLERDERMVRQLIDIFGDGFNDHPPAVLSGLFRNLFIMNFQKRLIGEDVFDDVAKLMIDLIADGLIREEK